MGNLDIPGYKAIVKKVKSLGKKYSQTWPDTTIGLDKRFYRSSTSSPTQKEAEVKERA